MTAEPTSAEVLACVQRMTEPDLREIAEATGVPYRTLAKIRYGATQDPRVSTIEALRNYFREHA